MPDLTSRGERDADMIAIVDIHRYNQRAINAANSTMHFIGLMVNYDLI